MKLQRTKVAPAAGSTVVGSANSSSSSTVVGNASNSYRIAEHCQFVQVNARYVRDLADEHVHAIVISLLSKQRKSFTIPMELFMIDNATITINFEIGITKTQIFWHNTDLVNSNIESGQNRHRQIKAYLTERYRKLKQQRNEKMASMLKTAINNEGKMEVEEEKEEGEI
uniref:Uncharacterized protein n=1 Tax=Globodera rostochiensis TaxID=31243 RepID=A0A914HQF9_GLORO